MMGAPRSQPECANARDCGFHFGLRATAIKVRETPHAKGSFTSQETEELQGRFDILVNPRHLQLPV